MEMFHVYALAGLAACIGTVFAITSYLGLPTWAAWVGMVMVSGGCLVLLADMNRPSGGWPGVRTALLMAVLFLPVMPVLLPLGLLVWTVSCLRRPSRRR